MSDPEKAWQRLATRRVYTGRVVSLDIDTVGFPNGSTGDLEMIRHSGASAVLPLFEDPDDVEPKVLLIRQFRYAAEDYVYEIPAGRLDPGELPETCAFRELAEETGYSAAQVRHLTTIYTTPGFTDERIHLFVASGLTPGQARPEADEVLDVHAIPLRDALEMVRRGEIVDGKTLVALLFVASFARPEVNPLEPADI